MRHVGNSGQHRAQLLVDLRRLLLQFVALRAQRFGLLHLRRGVLPGLFELGDLLRRAVPLRLQCLRLRDQLAAFFVHLAKAAQDVLRVHAPAAQHLFNLREVLSDVSKIKHESNYFTKTLYHRGHRGHGENQISPRMNTDHTDQNEPKAFEPQRNGGTRRRSGVDLGPDEAANLIFRSVRSVFIRGEVFTAAVYSRTDGKKDLLDALHRPRPCHGLRSAHLVESRPHPASAGALLVDRIPERMVSIRKGVPRCAVNRWNSRSGNSELKNLRPAAASAAIFVNIRKLGGAFCPLCRSRCEVELVIERGMSMGRKIIKTTLLATIVAAVLCAGTVSARQLQTGAKGFTSCGGSCGANKHCPTGCICAFPLESTTGFCSTHPTGVQTTTK